MELPGSAAVGIPDLGGGGPPFQPEGVIRIGLLHGVGGGKVGSRSEVGGELGEEGEGVGIRRRWAGQVTLGTTTVVRACAIATCTRYAA